MKNLAKKFVDVKEVFDFTTGEQIFSTDNFNFGYWMTYAEIRTARKFDYIVVPCTITSGSISHVAIVFEKLSEEEIIFLSENIQDIFVELKKRNFYPSLKNVWIENQKVGGVLINGDSSMIDWSF